MNVTAAFDNAVAERVRQLSGGWPRLPGDFDYHGRRTSPGEIGWRFRQVLFDFGHPDAEGNIGLTAKPTWAQVEDVKAGTHDARIEATFHSAAAAEWYYKHDKDYGVDSDERFSFAGFDFGDNDEGDEEDVD